MGVNVGRETTDFRGNRWPEFVPMVDYFVVHDNWDCVLWSMTKRSFELSGKPAFTNSWYYESQRSNIGYLLDSHLSFQKQMLPVILSANAMKVNLRICFTTPGE